MIRKKRAPSNDGALFCFKTALPAGRHPALAPLPRKTPRSGFPACGAQAPAASRRRRQACPRSPARCIFPAGFPDSGRRPAWTAAAHPGPAAAGSGQTPVPAGPAGGTGTAAVPWRTAAARPAHHFGDAHAGIVHHHGQLIGEHAVCPAQVEIAAVPQQVLGVRAHAAVHERDLFIRHHQAVGRGFLFAFFCNFGGGQAPAGAGVNNIAV